MHRQALITQAQKPKLAQISLKNKAAAMSAQESMQTPPKP
jgi:hypothetical protein